jgi:hypothetical protein
MAPVVFLWDRALRARVILAAGPLRQAQNDLAIERRDCGTTLNPSPSWCLKAAPVGHYLFLPNLDIPSGPGSRELSRFASSPSGFDP